jgi:hypothetical protein
MKTFKVIISIVILAIALFLLRGKLPMEFVKNIFNNEPIIDTVTTVEYKYDTINTKSEVYIPKWKDRVVVDVDSIFITQKEPIDTMSLLRDYYAKYYYEDTIDVDTFGYIVMKDTVSKNKIEARQYVSNILIPTKIVTNNILVNKREIYLGTGITGNKNFMVLNGEMLVRTKKRKAYGVGIGLDNNLSSNFTAKIYWRIGK